MGETMKLREIKRREDGSVRVATLNAEPSKTQKHFKDQCDVNKIIEKFKKTGQITHVANNTGVYADLSQRPDYFTALQTVVKAEQAFMSLPAKLRQKLMNDPANLLPYLQDPKNRDEAVSFGLMEKAQAVVSQPDESQPQGGQSEKK